jgi:hypothetical protein
MILKYTGTERGLIVGDSLTVGSLPEFICFEGFQRIAEGGLLEVAEQAKRHLAKNKHATLLVFDNWQGDVAELDLRGTLQDVKRRYSNRLEKLEPEPKPKQAIRGRPKLGVVSKEITLLPRHWQWLAEQPGGASVTLRKLVETARKDNAAIDQVRKARETLERFMYITAGNLDYYEDCTRFLYEGKYSACKQLCAAWPKDICEHITLLLENLQVLHANVPVKP